MAAFVVSMWKGNRNIVFVTIKIVLHVHYIKDFTFLILDPNQDTMKISRLGMCINISSWNERVFSPKFNFIQTFHFSFFKRVIEQLCFRVIPVSKHIT